MDGDMFPCPICGRLFARGEIDRHANQCLNNMGRGGPAPPDRVVEEVPRRRDMEFVIEEERDVAREEPRPRRLRHARDRRNRRNPHPRRRVREVEEGAMAEVEGPSASASAARRAVERLSDLPASKGVLYVRVVEAEKVRGGSLLFSPRVYARVGFEGQERRTPVAKHGVPRSPKWEGEAGSIVVRVSEYYAPSPLTVQLWDKSRFGRGTRLGSVSLLLGDIVSSQRRIISRSRMQVQRPKLAGVVDDDVSPQICSMCHSWFSTSSLLQSHMETVHHVSAEVREREAAADRSTRDVSSMNPMAQMVAVVGGGTVERRSLAGGESSEDPATPKEAAVRDAAPTAADEEEKEQADKNPFMLDRWLDIHEGGAVTGRVRLELCFVSAYMCREHIGPLRCTPGHWAALGGQGTLLLALVSYLSVSLTSQTSDGMTVLDLVAAQGSERHVRMLRKLTLSSAFSNRLLTTSERPDGTHTRNTLHFAVLGGSLEAVKLLYGIRPQLLEEQDGQGLTPFALACLLGKLDIVTELASYGVRIARAPLLSYSGATATLLAARGGHADVLKFLISKDADVNIPTVDGETPLQAAVAGGHSACVSLLLERGATHSPNAAGDTPLHMAVQAGSAVIVKQLLENEMSPPNLAAVNRAALTPLGLARKLGVHAIVDALVAAGAPEVGDTGDSGVSESKSDGLPESDVDAKPEASIVRDSRRAGHAVSVLSSLDWSEVEEDPDYRFFDSTTDDSGHDQHSGDYDDSDDDGTPEGSGAMMSPSGRRRGSLAAPLLPASSPARLMLVRQQSHVVMGEREMAEERTRQLTEVAETMQFPLSSTGLLLNAFKWDIDALLTAYGDDPEGTLKAAGLSALSRPAVPTAVSDGELFTCPACYDDVPPAESYALACGHRFCLECWHGHLAAMLSSLGPACVNDTLCLMHAAGCTEKVDEATWKAVCTTEEVERYQLFLVRSFVSLHPDVMWCPNPRGCERAVVYNGTRDDLECECGYAFCFRCGQEAHAPCGCEVFEKWRASIDKDQASAKWMMERTKRCPKCRIHIEKNEGCKHMTCRPAFGGCGHEFCWDCKGPWSEHGDHTGGFYRCNIYDPTKNYEEYEDGEEALRSEGSDIDRFIHYFQRYSTQTNAQQKVMDRITAFRAKPELIASLPLELRVEESAADLSTAADRAAALSYKATGALAEAERKRHCSFTATGRRFEEQLWYQCLSCGLTGGNGVCATCAEICHSSHRLGPARVSAFYCDCGSGSPMASLACCQALPRKDIPTLKRQLSGDKKELVSESKHESELSESKAADDGGVGESKEGDGDDSAVARVKKPEVHVPARTRAIFDALSAMVGFHRVLKFTYVHLFSLAHDHPSRELLEFSQQQLEQNAEALFALVDPALPLADLDLGAIRGYTRATSHFCDKFFEEVASQAGGYAVPDDDV